MAAHIYTEGWGRHPPPALTGGVAD